MMSRVCENGTKVCKQDKNCTTYNKVKDEGVKVSINVKVASIVYLNASLV